jgi:hypothetical protein
VADEEFRRASSAGELKIRRVVTTQTPDGRGVFARVESVEPMDSPPGRIIYPVWGLDSPLSLPVADVAGDVPASALPPAAGGYRLKVMTFLPDGPGGPPQFDRRAQYGERLRDLDPETGLYYTDSVDFVIVLDGEVTTLTSDGAEVTLGLGDIFVQNGTPHAWRNRSGAPCTIALVNVAAERAGD